MVACGPVRIVRTVLLICAAGCASRRSGAPAGAAPAGAPPAPHESLHVTVTYPAATDVIQAHDSSFLLGTVRGGAGPAGLSVNGTPVPVLPSRGLDRVGPASRRHDRLLSARRPCGRRLGG